MKAVLILILASYPLGAGPAAAWTHERHTEMRVVFDGSQQTHPAEAVIAVPITEPIIGVDNAGLSFEAMYMTLFRESDDPRNGEGKVIWKIEVIRDDQVLWKKTMKDKVTDDWDTTRDCGNCTHKLRACESYDGALQKGDLVLLRFFFQGMPRFDSTESATIHTGILSDPEECG